MVKGCHLQCTFPVTVVVAQLTKHLLFTQLVPAAELAVKRRVLWGQHSRLISETKSTFKKLDWNDFYCRPGLTVPTHTRVHGWTFKHTLMYVCTHTEPHTNTNSVPAAIPCAGGSSCFSIPSKTLSVDKADCWLGRTAGQPRSDDSFGIMVGLCECLS